MTTVLHTHEPYSHHPRTGFRCACGATAPTGAGPWAESDTQGCLICAAPTTRPNRLCDWHDTIFGTVHPIKRS